MKPGFSTIMSAQFFSSLADNALFVVAVELLRRSGAPEWQSAALVPMFALFYVLLAPFVGAFADAQPKGRVMFISNAIKVVGCLMMISGAPPLLAYAIVGLGAAAYSPAKYGILTELLPPSLLVKANGWIEGLTIASIILGVVLGGALVSDAVHAWLLALQLPGMAPALHNPVQAAMACIIVIYALAAFINLFIPRTSVARRPMWKGSNLGVLGSFQAMMRDFVTSNNRLWNDRLGQIALATTTLFWGVSGNLRYIVLAWSAVALGMGTTEASSLLGIVALGTAVGAVVSSTRGAARTRHQCAAGGRSHGRSGDADALGWESVRSLPHTSALERPPVLGGAHLRAGGLAGRIHGGAHECAVAASWPHADGRRPLHRGAELQRAGLHPGAGPVVCAGHAPGAFGPGGDDGIWRRGAGHDAAHHGLASAQPAHRRRAHRPRSGDDSPRLPSPGLERVGPVGLLRLNVVAALPLKTAQLLQLLPRKPLRNPNLNSV